MKIKLTRYDEYWYYNINETLCTQEQYDYIFKYLDFEKVDRDCCVFYNNKEIEKWFKKTYINSDCLNIIYNNSPEGYQWLKENWGKDIFNLIIWYSDKQEFKIIVNKVINIKLMYEF